MDGVLKVAIAEKTTMTFLRLIGAGVLLLAGGVAHADPCKVTIESNDKMQFSVHGPEFCRDVRALHGA
jgi:azurin